MKKALATLAAALIAAPALAEHTHIVVEDGVLIASVRAGFDVWPRGMAPSIPHTGHSFELGASGTKGSDEQDRTLGQPPLRFGGQTFAAPTTIQYDFRFRFYELAYRYRHFFGASRAIGIEGLGGLGHAQMELTASTPGQRATDTLESGGIVLGVGGIWNFLPQTSLQGRLTVFGSGEREGITGAARFDLFVAQAIGRHAAVRAGLTGWGLSSARDEHEDSTSPNSHIRASFGGLALGLEVMF